MKDYTYLLLNPYCHGSTRNLPGLMPKDLLGQDQCKIQYSASPGTINVYLSYMFC